ncbi:MAG: nickel-dependent lactate racemase [Deltaproteobacteria bacterium]|nr:nickel-dependent lactate racemase [Candidatus Anaeroferrophillus wilburensis]MBN2889798.1 nickel-dependent lactate racemase [Deltaproteobacteria bacterium]
MEITLRYGHDGLQVRLPETPGYQGVLRPREAPVIPQPDTSLAKALQHPIECQPLATLAAGKKNACIVISDVTRPVPNTTILPPLLSALEHAGLQPDNILILIATGIHRPNEGQELVNLVGNISDGVPAYVNRHYVEADLKILTGFIEPHMWAGYSGGRKSILPGISSIDTLEYMHGPEMIAHPNTVYGALEGNPFHEAGLTIMEKAGADFIVNVTLNTSKNITGIFAGHPVKAHLAGCRFLAPFCVHTLDEPLDFIVTTNSGAPLDCNLYQTVKGITGAAPVLKDQGTILIASACFEGAGSPEYCNILTLVDTPQHFIERLMAKEFFIPDQWCAQETYQVMLKHPVWLYTEGLSKTAVEGYHFTPVNTMEQAIDKLLAIYGHEARWAVVPDGPLLILKLSQQ